RPCSDSKCFSRAIAASRLLFSSAIAAFCFSSCSRASRCASAAASSSLAVRAETADRAGLRSAADEIGLEAERKETPLLQTILVDKTAERNAPELSRPAIAELRFPSAYGPRFEIRSIGIRSC